VSVGLFTVCPRAPEPCETLGHMQSTKFLAALDIQRAVFERRDERNRPCKNMTRSFTLSSRLYLPQVEAFNQSVTNVNLKAPDSRLIIWPVYSFVPLRKKQVMCEKAIQYALIAGLLMSSAVQAGQDSGPQPLASALSAMRA